MIYRNVIRPIADRIIATAALLVASPVFLFTAIAIFLEDGGPVFFTQERTGANNMSFVIRKFRSMPADVPQLASADARQLQPTRVGRIIRQLNIDELPQLLNVIAGDMALIGPRPSLTTQADVIAMRIANGSIALKPGITGLAQINGYDGMGTEEKCRYDGEYLQSMGPLLDLKILAGTIIYLFRKQPVV